MVSNGMVSGRLDDYYFKLYESSEKTGRELLEFALDILSKKDPALVSIRLDEIKKQRHLLDLEEKQLKEGIDIGIDIPDKAETPFFSVIEAVERYCDNKTSSDTIITPHDLEDVIILDIISANKARINIKEVRDYFDEKYPVVENNKIHEIEIDYDRELITAVKTVKNDFENHRLIYGKRNWESVEDIDFNVMKSKIKNFNVDPVDVAKELGISV